MSKEWYEAHVGIHGMYTTHGWVAISRPSLTHTTRWQCPRGRVPHAVPYADLRMCSLQLMDMCAPHVRQSRCRLPVMVEGLLGSCEVSRGQHTGPDHSPLMSAKAGAPDAASMNKVAPSTVAAI